MGPEDRKPVARTCSLIAELVPYKAISKLLPWPAPNIELQAKVSNSTEPRECCQEGTRMRSSSSGACGGSTAADGTTKHECIASSLLELGFDLLIDDVVDLLAVLHIERTVPPGSPQFGKGWSLITSLFKLTSYKLDEVARNLI